MTSGFDDSDKTPILLHPRVKIQMFQAGQNFFNEEQFYEAHEEWEKLWKMDMGSEKIYIQGLIQTAAHFWLLHHHRYSAAYRQGLAALDKLSTTLPNNSVYRSFDTEPLVSGIHYNLQALAPLLSSQSAPSPDDIRKIDKTEAVEKLIAVEAFLYPKLF